MLTNLGWAACSCLALSFLLLLTEKLDCRSQVLLSEGGVFSGRNCHGYQKNTSPEIWIKIDANPARYGFHYNRTVYVLQIRTNHLLPTGAKSSVDIMGVSIL
jgi:hypothetical protein